MARKKIELTPAEVSRREKSKQRVSAFLSESEYPIYRIAQKMGISDSTLRNYKRGTTYISDNIASVFQNHTGIVRDYWTGRTDIRTIEDWKVAQEEERRTIYDDSWNAVDPTAEEKRHTVIQNTALFERCGFTYSNLSGTAYEFLQNADGEHKITSASDPSLSVSFTDEELERIINRMHELIESECLKKMHIARQSKQ